ncbi:hypothetical protein AMATHDRAFT_5847 [Amanita thiersii Skay4041]|uniref:Retrotransposon gag domain-containing protein n=1 Tax=Amanita thiersii Skay4041 TaxID=703135 RepID=A0A2A9NJF0_9AGAR|nr:hypothetical protein AMATHDRAFT_5847 [Amanita thiersii Skay4041]
MDPLLYTLLLFYYLFRIIFFPFRMMVNGGTSGTNKPDWSLDQALAQIQQLLGTVNTLQHTIVQQGQMIAQLQVQIMAPVPGQVSVSRGPKMATPLIYDGSMATCKGFINSCWSYMVYADRNGPTLPGPFPHILYMATLEYQAQYEESTEPDQIELLYKDIYKAFGDPNKQATAIQEIMTIRQGSHSGEEHVQLFKQSFMRSGYSKVVGIHKFKWSLNSPLLDKCMAVPELPTTLEKWYELVIQLDQQWRQAQAERKVFAAQGSSSTSGQMGATQCTNQQRQTTGNNQQQGSNQQTQWNWQPPVNCTPQTWRPPVQPAQRDPNAMQVTWCGGTDADRDKLWWMVTSGGVQAGGGVAHIEEVPAAPPATIAAVAQPPVVPLNPPGFQFGQ